MDGEGTPSVASEPWFEKPRARKDDADPTAMAKAEVGTTLNSQVNVLEMSPVESWRRNQMLFDLELYFGSQFQSLYQNGSLGSAGVNDAAPESDTILFNVCYSIPSTIRNRICSFRPRAQFLPNGGDYKAQDGARDMTDMSDAWAVEVGYQAQASLAFRDLLTGDGGVLKVYIEDDKVGFGRFPAWEFMVDEAESIYGKPQCWYHVTYKPLEQAQALYPHLDAFLMTNQVVGSPAGIMYCSNRQMVRITEAWKMAAGTKPRPMPSAEECDAMAPSEYQRLEREHAQEKASYTPGRRVVTVGEQTDTDEEWEWDAPPLIVRTFDENTVGIWGVGAVRMLRADQLELLKEQEVLRAAHENASAMVISKQEMEESPTKITNDYVRIETFKNIAPTINTPPAVNQERYKYVELLISNAYDKIGISKFLAAGTKQPGVTSAVAIDASSEMQSDRLALCSQIWESMCVETAKWWWRFTKVLGRRGVKPKWRAIQRGVWRELVFEDLDGEYEIRPFPTSLFGQTVSGRLNKAMDAADKGWIEREDALQAVDVPDLSPITDLILAPRRYMQALVDGILRKGLYKTPSPYIDPAAMQSYARNRYLQADADESNYPEANMALLRRLIDSLAKSPTTLAATSAPSAAAAGPVAPQPAAPLPTLDPAAAPELTPAQMPGLPPGAMPVS